MIRAVREPRWLAGLAVAVGFAVVCVLLAQWQLDRRVSRAEANAAVLVNYGSAPVPLDEAVDDPRARPGAQEQWQPVLLQGSYDPAGTVLVRNRPQGGGNGYLVAVPFTTQPSTGGATTLLLVRGWVPSGADASTPGTAVPAPPEGQVQVLARLRSGESPSTRDAPAGQTYRIDLPELLAAAGPPGADVLTGAYGVVAEEQGSRPEGLVPVPRPDTDPGPHLAYGVQWYLFAVAGLVIWAVLARRHGADHGATDGTASGSGSGSDGSGTGGTGRAGAGGPDDGASTAARRGWVYEPGR